MQQPGSCFPSEVFQALKGEFIVQCYGGKCIIHFPGFGRPEKGGGEGSGISFVLVV